MPGPTVVNCSCDVPTKPVVKSIQPAELQLVVEGSESALERHVANWKSQNEGVAPLYESCDS